MVADLVSQVVCEHGAPADFGQPERAAVLVHWAVQPVISRSLRELVRQLSGHGYRTVIVSAAEFEQRLDWGDTLPAESIVLRKPNIGYDFGSWAVGLGVLPAITRAPYVILANDSVLGPFTDIGDLLADFESSIADVWGLTDTRQFSHHLQSYFLGYRNGVLAERPLQDFFAGVRQERSKWEIIKHNELALSRLLHREGYITRSAFRGDDVVDAGDNPVIAGWHALIERGFPFVKRQIVNDPEVAPHGELIAREVQAIFGVRLEDWI
ncbi:MAG TPA: rhamnan synthesis F family protein [Jatrophihabitans sp.]|nr:rhamnan synthesis F family protein [Jatrophihabitans sp.]